MKPKLYSSAAWLRTEYLVKKRKIDDIAKQCGVSHNTIRSALRKNNLLR